MIIYKIPEITIVVEYSDEHGGFTARAVDDPTGGFGVDAESAIISYISQLRELAEKIERKFTND